MTSPQEPTCHDDTSADKSARAPRIRLSSATMADGGFHAAYSLLVKLCRLGARPPVIRNLVPPFILRPLIFATYKAITGTSPPQGQLPLSVKQCLESRTLRLHATSVLILSSRYEELPIEDQCIRTYEAYRAMMGSEWVFDFNRVWFLCRAQTLGRIRLVKCKTCQHPFAVNYELITDWDKCPVCAVLKTAGGQGATDSQVRRDDLTAGQNRKRLARERTRETS